MRAWARVEAVLALAALAVAGAGAVFSLYLTWLEAERIHAYCAWCLASAVIWTLAAAAAAADAATT